MTMRRILIAFGLTVAGAVSAIGTIVVLDESHDSLKAPEDVLRISAVSAAVVLLGPIGTIIAGLRWLRYRFF